MIRTKWINGIEYSRIELDVRDGSQDYWLPTKQAKKLYESGKLDFDITNKMFMTPETGVIVTK